MLKLDDYTLEKFLGKGTFGEVYLTKKFNSNNLYATKRMERKMVDDPRYIKYFKNEITILKRLFHNNIIRLEELKMTNNHYYIIMEYCNGGSLSDCPKRYKELYHHPFTEQIVQHIMRQVISAVKYMHSQGIIHRDLKLDNILVNFNNVDDFNSINLINSQIKIIDFGFASSKEDNKLFSTAIGSPLNMDPLILKKFNNGRVQSNDLYYDEKADIWSLGALCYEMLIGNCPFDAYNMEELLSKIEEGTYKVPTNFSREVVSFLNGMLQYNPQKRLTAENLSNHSFLTKNVNNFTKINTNMISRKVYGGQLNINIKNNQSIWAIFNEESQNELDNVPINNYMEVSPISESLYYPNEDNTFGITTEQTNYNQNYQNNYYNNQVNSVPIFGTNSNSTFLFEINKNNNATSSFLLSEKFKAEYKCQIISNKNKPFSLTIKNMSNFLEINAFYQAIFQKKEYTKKYSFGELKEIRFLSICDTIDEIFEELKFEFSNNSPRIEEDINKINVILPNTHTKFKEITFELFEKIKLGSDIFEELYLLIDDLKKKWKIMKKKRKK